MSEIARLYCTHCTFGTSALETASADNTAKVLGYSVRASSLPDADRGRLRQVFRSIERLLSYDLPRDASAADKEKLDAASAPRRLIFLPSLGDSQVVGQVCYRTHDTAGRPGSYFADMIVSRLDPRQPEQSWSPVECLELWAADYDGSDRGGWWCDSEDSLAGRDRDGSATPIAPVAAVREIRALAEPNRLPLVSVDVLRAFLFGTADRIDTLDAGRVIPPRWRDMSAETRREFFARLLQATIDILQQPRDTLVLAVEPSLAALLFYGVCRLLPPKLTTSSRNSSGISFSTYEPFPERPMTRLVATTFLHGDASADLPADVYQRGFACNTFRDDCNSWQSTAGRGRVPKPGDFVNKIVDRLAIGGATGTEAAQEVNELLQAINSLDKISARSLDGLIRIDEFVTEYATGSRPIADLKDGPRIQPKTDEEVFRRQRFRRLIEQGASESRTEWPSDLLPTAIDWLGDSLSDLWREDSAVVRLLRRWLPTSPEGLKHLARSKPPEEVIRDAVVSVARAQGRLPDCLTEILDDFSRTSRGDKSAAMLAEILSGLEDPQNILLASNPTLLGDRILAALQAIITTGNPPPPDFVERLLVRILDDEKRASDDKWSVLWKFAKLAESAPRRPQKLGKTLDELFDRLVMSPPYAFAGGERDAAYKALQHWASLTTKRERNHALLLCWKALFDSLATLTAEAKTHVGKKLWSAGTSRQSGELQKVFQTIDELNAEPSQEWSPQRVSRRRDKLKQALKLVKPADDVRQRVEGWIDDELKEEQKLATAGESRGLKTEIIWGGAISVLVICMVAIGVVAFYSGVGREWLPFAGRVAAEKPDKTELKKRTLDAENKSDEKVPKADVETAHSTRGRAPAPAPKESHAAAPLPKPLDPADLGLKATFEGGELVVTWNKKDLKSTQAFFTIEGLNINEFQPILKDQPAVGSEFRYPSQCHPRDKHAIEFATKYRVTLTATTSGDPVSATYLVPPIEEPPSPLVKGIDLDLGSPETPSIKVSLTKPADLREYGEVEYRLTCKGKTVGQAAVPKGEAVFAIPIKKQEWRPEDLREAACTLCVIAKSISSPGKPSKPAILKADIDEFMKRHLTGQTILDVPHIWPLEPDKSGRTSSQPLGLHPFDPPGNISIDLVHPKYSDDVKLTLKPDNEVWNIFQTPGASNSDRTSPDVSQASDNSQPSASDEANGSEYAPEIAVGQFRVNRSDPWNPFLEYVDPLTAPAAATKRTDANVGWRLAAGKLIIRSKGSGEPHVLQLMKPIAVPPIELDFHLEATPFRSVVLSHLSSVVSKTACWFRCNAPELPEQSELTLQLKDDTLGQKLTLSLGQSANTAADASLKFFLDNNLPSQELRLYPLKLANQGAGSDDLLRPTAATAEQILRQLKKNAGPKDKQSVDSVIERLTRQMKQTKEFQQWARQVCASDLHDWLVKESTDVSKRNQSDETDFDVCIRLVRPLKARDEDLERFRNELKQTKLLLNDWRIVGRISKVPGVGDTTIMVCDPNMPAERFSRESTSGSQRSNSGQ